MYVQIYATCNKHMERVETFALVVNVGSEGTYEVSPQTLECPGEGPHEFMLELSTSDGLSARIPIPSAE